MNDSFGGDGFNTTATGGAQSEQKPEGVAPVVIKQVQEVSESTFTMWGMTCGMVTTVAIVRNIETSSTKVTYLLEDHTGQMDAHYWIEEGESLKSSDVMINNYVRVFGTIRQHAGKKTLMIFKISPVTDANEITTHLLEVLCARYKAEEFSKKTGGEFSDFAMGGGGGGFSVQQSDANFGLEAKQSAVFQAIKNHVSEEGISLQELQQKFKHISSSELQNITEFLTGEGHIYSSIDTEHFLCTNC